MRFAKSVVGFIALSLAVGFASAFLFPPGGWYAMLNKPWFNPPDWLFAPVWLVLYVMIGIAGALVRRWDPQSAANKLWFAQLALNVAWVAVFFGLHLVEPALGVIILLLLLILSFIRRTKKELPSAAWLFTPYLLWVTYAALLNAAIVYLN